MTLLARIKIVNVEIAVRPVTGLIVHKVKFESIF